MECYKKDLEWRMLTSVETRRGCARNVQSLLWDRGAVASWVELTTVPQSHGATPLAQRETLVHHLARDPLRPNHFLCNGLIACGRP